MSKNYKRWKTIEASILVYLCIPTVRWDPTAAAARFWKLVCGWEIEECQMVLDWLGGRTVTWLWSMNSFFLPTWLHLSWIKVFLFCLIRHRKVLPHPHFKCFKQGHASTGSCLMSIIIYLDRVSISKCVSWTKFAGFKNPDFTWNPTYLTVFGSLYGTLNFSMRTFIVFTTGLNL